MLKVRDMIEIATAFAVAWLLIQGLALAAGTSMPIVSVASESMEPILQKGDLVFVISPENLKTGDIIIYDPKEYIIKNSVKINCFKTQKTIIHRINSFTADGKIITKGDHNPRSDLCPVEMSQLHGKVMFVVPILGYPRSLIYDTIGF